MAKHTIGENKGSFSYGQFNMLGKNAQRENKFVNYLKSKSLKGYPYKNEYLIQLFMGLKVGECLSLDFHDIDLKNKKIK